MTNEPNLRTFDAMPRPKGLTYINWTAWCLAQTNPERRARMWVLWLVYAIVLAAVIWGRG